MLPCRTRVAALLALLIATFSMAGGPAHAAVPAAGGSPGCALPQAQDDDTISILGRICDRREQPQVPVPDVKVTVEDSGGNPVGEATTGVDGTFVVDLPGTAIDNLGKVYTVTIDKDTLPKDTGLKDLSREVPINLDNDQAITFLIGEAPGSSTGTFTQGLQLLVGGIVFSVLLAMAALGLSMIFGTTGLTNFAHGELITFGALVAYLVDQLPGEIRIGGSCRFHPGDQAETRLCPGVLRPRTHL